MLYYSQVLRQKKSKIRKNEIQYFIVQHFPFFRQKLSVVLNCTPRSEKGRRAAAVEPYPDIRVSGAVIY